MELFFTFSSELPEEIYRAVREGELEKARVLGLRMGLVAP